MVSLSPFNYLNMIYSRYLISFIISIGMLSCSKLTEQPDALLISEQFYRNGEEATAAVTANYSKLYESGQSLYNSLLQIGIEMATDDYEAGPRARNAHVRAISGLTHDASNDRMEELWRQSYDAIYAANNGVEKIEAIEATAISEELRQRLIAELKFLRALHYFNLVRFFGDVPLLLNTNSSLEAQALRVSKSPEAEVYTQIIADLTAAQSLPSQEAFGLANAGRATSGAARALLAKVYLTQRNYTAAAAKALEVINSREYRLFDHFSEVFEVAHKNTVEHIFSAQFQGNAGYQGNSLAGRSAPTDIPGINGDYADALHLEGGLYESFEAADTRRDVTFVSALVSPVNGQLYQLSRPQFHKYYDESVIGNPYQSSKNLPIIRYAEVLLIYAEALNEQLSGPSAAAYEALNQVRSRAGISSLNPGHNQLVFRELVLEERRKELVFEYQRWFDLVRQGPEYYMEKLHAAGKTLAAPRHIHFPTPQRELNINPNLQQHPDWINN